MYIYWYWTWCICFFTQLKSMCAYFTCILYNSLSKLLLSRQRLKERLLEHIEMQNIIVNLSGVFPILLIFNYPCVYVEFFLCFWKFCSFWEGLLWIPVEQDPRGPQHPEKDTPTWHPCQRVAVSSGS